MSCTSLIYLILLAAGASFVQRTIGFGFGIFIMTVLPFLMPSYGEAVTLSGLLSLTSATVVMVKYLKYVTWKRMIPIVAAFVMFSTIAISLLDRIEGQAMRVILGIMLVLISLYFSFFKDKLQKIIRPTKGWQFGAGTASGIMGGLFGMHGPPVVLYLISSEPDKDHYMGMIQTYAVITNIAMLIVRAFAGYVTPAVGGAYLYGLAGLAMGVIAGNWAYRRIPGKLFTYIVYAYIGVCGLVIFLTAI
jgi:uncharacterized membrane protein YfcA